MAFDLLQDFWVSMEDLDVSGVDVRLIDRELVDKEIRARLTSDLDAVEGPVAPYDYTWLRQKASAAIRPDEYCITLDHQVYFVDADFALDLSRTAPNMHRTGSQHLTRRPRDMTDLPAQLAALSSRLATSRTSRVVVADDGLSTGQTLSTVISRCKDYGIDVRRAIVCCNNTELTQLKNSVKVSAIIKRNVGRPWLNERDLYWGLPRSGLTLAPLTKRGRAYSIPFSVNAKLVQQRICVEDDVDEFRLSCLRATKSLWSIFEDVAGHPLTCEDCPPLRFIPDIVGDRHRRVIDLLTDLIDGTATLALGGAVDD